MKVIQLSKFYKPYCGGLESVVADISEGLIEENYDVTVISSCNYHSKKHDKIKGVTVVRSKELFSFASVSFAPTYIMNVFSFFENDNIIHVHLPNPLANLALLISSIFSRNKPSIIIHWHSDIVKQKTLLFFYKPFVNWLLRKSKRIIVTSERYLIASEQLKKFESKCVVVPIGINSIASLVNKNESFEIRKKFENKKIVFSLGRHIYYKGFEILIEAAKDVENAVFLIGGMGPDTNKYMKLIDKHSVNDRVFLVGRIEDFMLPNYYDAADVFCFPSIEKSEAFGVVQLESMSIGTPVVSTNIEGSGVPWVNKHEVSGFVCEPKNSKSLSDSLNNLIVNNNLREQMSINAKDRFSSIFTRETMVKSIIDIYRDI